MPPKIVLSQARIPIKIWTDDVEPGAIDQLVNTANLPFVVKHVAAMADVHVGSGATIGSVIATQGAIIPSAVGVDIGCGVIAVKLKGLTLDKLDGKLATLRHSIERSIPSGFNGNRRIDKEVSAWEGWNDFEKLDKDIQKEQNDAEAKLCSLGGGNHFIEVCVDPTNTLWVMIHSGSRNIGLKIATLYITRAKDLMEKMFIKLPDKDLSYLPQDTPEYVHYLNDLKWAQSYAMQNRKLMLQKVLKDVFHTVGEPLDLEMEINCHHNFAEMEHHYDQNLLITRKGAVRARVGELAIIPGSMGTRSYIVRGRGNEESFTSSSHGAGRRMSRSEAKKTFSQKDIDTQLAGIECRKDKGILDELPGAYKDIEEVIKNQDDLVEVVTEIKQVLCVKG